MLGVIAQNELLLVCVAEFHGLLADEVVEVALLTCVDEAVGADPQTARDDLLVLLSELERLLTAVIVQLLGCRGVLACEIARNLVVLVPGTWF